MTRARKPVRRSAASLAHAHGHRTAALPDLTRRLRQRSRRITGPRQAVLDVLRQHPHPLTIREIFDLLVPGNCDLATIYRSMHLLEGMGMVKKFDFGDGSSRFELVAEGDDGHHHHLVCTKCSTVIEIDECYVEDLQARIMVRSGFKAVTHALEFFGVCPECQ